MPTSLSPPLQATMLAGRGIDQRTVQATQRELIVERLRGEVCVQVYAELPEIGETAKAT